MMNQGRFVFDVLTIADYTPLATPRGFKYPKRQQPVQGFGNVEDEDQLRFLEVFSGQGPKGL